MSSTFKACINLGSTLLLMLALALTNVTAYRRQIEIDRLIDANYKMGSENTELENSINADKRQIEDVNKQIKLLNKAIEFHKQMLRDDLNRDNGQLL